MVQLRTISPAATGYYTNMDLLDIKMLEVDIQNIIYNVVTLAHKNRRIRVDC